MTRLSVEVRSEAAARLLRETAQRTQDLRRPFGAFNVDVERFFERQFRSSGLAGGQRWKPLAPATRVARLRSGGNRGGVTRPLWDFGRLRASLVKTGPDSIRVIRRTEYVRGTSVKYAVAHQLGLGVPERKIIPDVLPDRVTDRLEVHVAEHLERN